MRLKFKYVGHGANPPERINFMGRVEFTLNSKRFVDVEDPFLCSKLSNNKCFISKESIGEAVYVSEQDDDTEQGA